MDACPTEVVTRVVEYSCSGDFGATARQVGLVSKYFRAIAEQFEFRAVAVSGPNQLRGLIARIQSSYTFRDVEVPVIDIRYLFISELKREHAVAADMNFRNNIEGYLPRKSFWETKRGFEAEVVYRSQSEAFWRSVKVLVGWAASNLRTLHLLSSENVFPSQGSWVAKYISPKALGVLSGGIFPSLIALTIRHDASNELRGSEDGGSLFRMPSVPSLEFLHISSPIFIDFLPYDQIHQPRLHPLLAAVRSDGSMVKRLVICDDRMWTAEMGLEAIFGGEWRELLSSGSLPGNLRSVVLRRGIMPDFGSTNIGLANYRSWMQNFVDTVAGLNVHGLEARHPTPSFPEAGKREYELLLAEWKELCLADGL